MLKSVELDEANKPVRILTSEDQLSLAIGKRGQNARLTSKLTGWQVDIEAEVVVTKGFEEKVAEAVETLAAIPGIARPQADVLVHHGLTRLEDLLQADQSDLAEIPEIGDQAAAVLEAVRAEAARRTIDQRHFDVQLMGGIILHQGKIAEMATGEGKTLVATLPVYLNALTGEGVHVITVNDYLAKRDRGWMGPVYEFLGLSVGDPQAGPGGTDGGGAAGEQER